MSSGWTNTTDFSFLLPQGSDYHSFSFLKDSVSFAMRDSGFDSQMMMTVKKTVSFCDVLVVSENDDSLVDFFEQNDVVVNETFRCNLFFHSRVAFLVKIFYKVLGMGFVFLAM